MPRIRRRAEREIETLALEIRRLHPFTGSVRTWLRQHLDLIGRLQDGIWQPQTVAGEPPRMVHPSRWQMEDIRLALLQAGIQYGGSEPSNGTLTLATLNVEISKLRREKALASAIEDQRPDALERFVPRSAVPTRGRPARRPSEDGGTLVPAPPEPAPRPVVSPSLPPRGPAPAMVPAWKTAGEPPRQNTGLAPSEALADQIQRKLLGERE